MTLIHLIILPFLYFFVALLGYEGWFRPEYVTPESWYSRSGALLILISLYAELKILPNANLNVIESKNNKDEVTNLMVTKWVIHSTVIYGTIAWAYGDLYFNWYKENRMLTFTVSLIIVGIVFLIKKGGNFPEK